MASSSQRNQCRACRLAPPHFVRAISCGMYEGSMRAVIHALKFEGMAPVARELGRRLAGAIGQMAEDAPQMLLQPVLVVPAPLHRARMRQRRFNQARMLAGEAVRALGKSHPGWELELSREALVRQRATKSQAGLSARQRRQNLRGAFFVSDPESVRGRHVLLVDDIYTTGATARACSRTLVEAGAASVSVATLARAQRRVPARIVESRRYLRLVEAERDGPEEDEEILPENWVIQ